MGSFIYRLKEIWAQHKREITRYAICAWFIFIGLVQSQYTLVWAGFGAAVLMYAFDRWGRPWAERGKMLIKGNKPDQKDS